MSDSYFPILYSSSFSGLSTPPCLHNANARAITQSILNPNSSPSISPNISPNSVGITDKYSDYGLNGTNVVIGVADSGVDEGHCYFSNTPVGTGAGPVYGNPPFVPRSTYQNPKTYDQYRKIIQYISNNADSNGDYYNGHGTHVVGTLAGYDVEKDSDTASGSNMNKGMAPNAKIAFYDILNTNQEVIIPYDLSNDMFAVAYQAKARLHSNSWAGGYWYDSLCQEVDNYLFENPDFLIFFAAGNTRNGITKEHSVLSPSLSKNAVSVGASVNELLNEGVVASFSNIGEMNTSISYYILFFETKNSKNIVLSIYQNLYIPSLHCFV